MSQGSWLSFRVAVTCKVSVPLRVATHSLVTAHLFVHFLGSSGLLAFSACPRWAQSRCSSGVIWVGVSPAGTELHRVKSSNPGAEKMKVRLIGSVPMFSKLNQAFTGSCVARRREFSAVGTPASRLPSTQRSCRLAERFAREVPECKTSSVALFYNSRSLFSQ